MLLINIKQHDQFHDGKSISDSIAYFTRVYMICLIFPSASQLALISQLQARPKLSAFWSVGPRRPSDESDAIMAGCLYMYLAGYLGIWLSGHLGIFLSRRRVPTSFPQWPSNTLWCLLFKKVNHSTMTTLNIRSDPMATWECAKLP